MRPARLTAVTLGCKVNQYETELIREGLQRAGYVDTGEDESADLCIVNTCTVTSEGDAKSRQVIRRLARRHPEARIVVLGCYATRAPQEVRALPNVVEVVTDKREIPDLLGRLGVIDVPSGISRFGDRHRAFLKVQDGCLLRCSYCIIPYVRPVMQSRTLPEIVSEARRLIDNGYRELVLTGIHLGHYGVDFNRQLPKSQWTRLSHLVARLAELPGDFRLRLSSIEATEVTHELVQVLKDRSDRIVPHLHLCLQSGSDAILRRMNRRWGRQRFIDRCQFVQTELDLPAITTDIIVGFPGETEDDFELTLDVARRCGFSKIHIFPFSARKGTPAAEMTDPIPVEVRRERSARLDALECQLRASFQGRLRGRALHVLAESPDPDDPGYCWGTSCRYLPVRLPSRDTVPGAFRTVLAGPSLEDGVVGIPLG